MHHDDRIFQLLLLEGYLFLLEQHHLAEDHFQAIKVLDDQIKVEMISILIIDLLYSIKLQVLKFLFR